MEKLIKQIEKKYSKYGFSIYRGVGTRLKPNKYYNFRVVKKGKLPLVARAKTLKDLLLKVIN